MNARLLELALKKQRLQYRSAEQRRELARGLMPLVPVFALAETARSWARRVRAHPAIATGVLVAILATRPRRAVRWVRRTWWAWQTWRKLRLITTARQSPQAG